VNLSGFLAFGKGLSARSALANVFCESRNRHSALRFVLNPIDATEDRRLSGSATAGPHEPRNRLQTDSRCHLSFMRERNFNAIGMTNERDIQARMLCGQRLEGFLAGGHYCSLELSDSFIFQAGIVTKIARNTANRSRKSDVCVDMQTNCF
jgi:hypothetical protein